MGAPGLAIREDVATPTELRRLAKKEPRRRTAQRMLALANALDGMNRAEAARAAGIERQSLRDAVVRFNAEGLAGLIDQPCGGRPAMLSEGEQAALVAYVLRGPDPAKGEPSSWTLPDLCRFIEDRFDKRMCPQSMSRVVRRLGLSRQKARPVHPERDAKAAEAFAKGGSPAPSRPWPKLIPTNASPSGAKMKPASDRRVGPRTAGG
jgi:transposase